MPETKRQNGAGADADSLPDTKAACQPVKQPVNQAGKAVTALDLPPMDPMPEDIGKYFALCAEKLGMVPNVLQAYSFDEAKFRAFSQLYNNLMLDESGLSKLEREMIAVVVSSINRCFYCLVAHGQAVRQLSGDPLLGELMVMNYRAADLSERHVAMLDYAAKLTEMPDKVTGADRDRLRAVGFSDRDIWDIANVTGFFNMSNRVAIASDMTPNDAYHGQNR